MLEIKLFEDMHESEEASTWYHGIITTGLGSGILNFTRIDST